MIGMWPGAKYLNVMTLLLATHDVVVGHSAAPTYSTHVDLYSSVATAPLVCMHVCGVCRLVEGAPSCLLCCVVLCCSMILGWGDTGLS